MRCLYEIYKSRVARVYESRTNRALVHNYFIARKYCVLSRYVANNYINVFPANTFFNDAYQTLSDAQFIATGRVAPVMGYDYIYHAKSPLNTPVWGSLRSPDKGLQSTVLLMCQFKSNEYTQTTLLKCGALAREVLHMNNPFKFTKSRHSGMQ